MNKEHIALIKHTGNYLAAVIASRALSFISIPVLTYLLAVEDYGTINVFQSTAAVFAIILTLNTEVAISRYYYDAKDEDDFKRFVGTSIKLSLSIFIFLSLGIIVFNGVLADFFGFERLLVLCILPNALYAFTYGVFQQIYQPQLKSRKIAILSSISAYLGFAFSVTFVLMMTEKKYYGVIFGSLAVQLCVGIYMVTQILKFTKNCFDLSYLKYILTFTLPYLPYSLSSIIVAQFGKMILGQQEGFNSAGLYSFAQNLSGLMMVIIMVVHSAWNPYHMRYMTEKNYTQIDEDYDIIWRVTLVGGAFLSIFGYEIGAILARPQYLSAIHLVPILVLGYIFYQWSFVYLRNSAFVKRTIWNAFCVISSGIINVLLNSLLIDSLQLVGVALSFSISYAFMLLLSWIANKFILKAYTPNTRLFIRPFLLYLPIVAVSLYFGRYEEISIRILSVKFAILGVFLLIVLYKYYHSKLCLLLNCLSKH